MVDFTRGLFTGLAKTDIRPANQTLLSLQRAKGVAALAGAQTAANRLDLDRDRFEFGKQFQVGQEQRAQEAAPLINKVREQQALGLEASRITKGLDFISNHFGSVTDEASLARVNKLAIDSGVIPENLLPQSVGEARERFETSELFKIRLDANTKFALARQKFKDQKALINFKAKLDEQSAKREQERKKELIKERSEKGLVDEIRKLRIIRREGLKDKGPLVNINLPEGIVARQDGGPVAAGQPALVGEAGPELIVPDQNVQVINNQETQQLADASSILTPEDRDIIAQGDIPIEPSVEEKAKPLASSAAQDLADVESAIKDLDELSEFISQAGGLSNKTILKSTPLSSAVLDSVLNVFRSGDEQSITAIRDNVSDVMARMRTGARVDADEAAKFNRLLLEVGDTPEVQAQKVIRLRLIMNSIQSSLKGKKASDVREVIRREFFIDRFIQANKKRLNKEVSRDDALKFIKDKNKSFK